MAVACYLDLDNLKAFNDYYGYAKANAVIRQTGDVIRNEIHSQGVATIAIDLSRRATRDRFGAEYADAGQDRRVPSSQLAIARSFPTGTRLVAGDLDGAGERHRCQRQAPPRPPHRR